MIVGFDATTVQGRLSGVGYYTSRLLESLGNGAADGLIQRLLVLSNLPLPAPAGERVVMAESRGFAVRSAWMQLALPRILRRLRPDLVHFTNYLAPLRSPVPYVVSIHDMSLALLPRYHTLKKRLLTSALVPAVSRAARLVLTPSESTRRDVIRILRLDAGRVRAIPYAPAVALAPATEGPGRLASEYGVRQPYFLFVGTLEPRKNLPRLLRAFASVADALPAHTLVLVGQRGWKCADVLAQAARPPLRERLVMPGYVREEDLALFYTHASALVYVSLYEGFGLPVVEAMACGTPVITSRGSSLEEIAADAALLVDPLDEAAIAGGMHRMATDAGLAARLRAAGRAAAERYSWRRTARLTAEAYREALAASPARGGP